MIKLNTTLPEKEAFLTGLNEAEGTTFNKETFVDLTGYVPVDEKNPARVKITLVVNDLDNKYKGTKDIVYDRVVTTKMLRSKNIRIPFLVYAKDQVATEDDIIKSFSDNGIKLYPGNFTFDDKNIHINNMNIVGSVSYDVIKGKLRLQDILPPTIEILNPEEVNDCRADSLAIFKQKLVEKTKTDDFLLSTNGLIFGQPITVTGSNLNTQITITVPENHPYYQAADIKISYARYAWDVQATVRGYTDRPFPLNTYASNFTDKGNHSEIIRAFNKQYEVNAKLPTSVVGTVSPNDPLGTILFSDYLFIESETPLELFKMKIDIADAIANEEIDMFEI